MPMPIRSRQTGFSLIELVIVIVLTGILAISLSSLTQYSIIGYIDAKDRNSFSQSAKWITERIAREAREALPQSVRVNTSGANVHCVEFMNIHNASAYFNLPASGSISSFDAVEYNLSFSAGLMVAIMPTNAASIYNVTGTLGNVASITDIGNAVTIALTGPTIFDRRSPRNRFYLLDSPISFCLSDNNGQLSRYSGYSITASQALPPVGGTVELMGENLAANGAVFSYQSGALSRAGLLQMNLRSQNRTRNLPGNAESFEVFQEVHIRNVP